MRKSKKTTQEEKPVNFTFKITNLRTSAFPGPLEKTDYLELKPGDIVTKGSENTVYEVVHITREPMTEIEWARYVANNKGYNNQVRDEKLQKLLDLYHKSGNFGVCQVHCRPIIRGGKQIAKGRLVKWLEADYPNFKYNGYRKTSLQGLMTHRQGNINNIDYQINRFKTKKDIQVNAYNVLKAVYDIKFPPVVQASTEGHETEILEAKIEVRDQNGTVIGTLQPSQIL